MTTCVFLQGPVVASPQCRVCQGPHAELTCDKCGEAAHVQCALLGGGYVVCQVCYSETLQTFGAQQLAQAAWLREYLDEERKQRTQRLHEELLQRTAQAGAVAGQVGAAAGSAVGATAAVAARGLEAFAQ
eukprot:1280671-Amphidinium_carterae.1